MAADPPRTTTIAKLLSFLGVFPLGVYVLFHLWETAAAPRGAAAFAESVSGGGSVALVLETALVLVPLGLHAALGIARTVRERPIEPGGYPSAGARSWMRATGVGVLVFLVVHLGHTWTHELGGLSGVGLYQALNDEVGRPLMILVYVVGITCVAFHLALGLAALPETWGFARTDAGRRGMRALGAVVGLVVWLVSLNTLSHFAVGRAVVGAQEPAIAPADGTEVAP